MNELQSSLHLYQPPKYKAKEGQVWRNAFIESVRDLNEPASWDVAAILGIFSFNYTTGDRTLFNEIKRQPWLSGINEQGDIRYEAIPPHGLNWECSESLAEKLIELLLQEAEDVCKDKKEIYLLLSGGLDSRIVAGVVGRLYKQGKVPRPIGVTWGLEDSRDVHYARKIADILEFDWQHISISPQTVLKNIHEGFPLVAGLVPPHHLHAMLWFENVPRESLVLGGSYGDMIGRAEFSGRHLLELNYLKPYNPFGLLTNEVVHQAREGIASDVEYLRQRASQNVPDYVRCEHQMHGFYTRNMLGQAMSSICHYCNFYQMFTAPQVYSYMWSLHPARRDDTIYMCSLEKLSPKLLELPWARTNRALSGRTVGAISGLRKDFHRYQEWLSGPVMAELADFVDPEWFGATGVFDPASVKKVCDYVRQRIETYGFKPYEKWAWLASFRSMAESLEKAGHPGHLKVSPSSHTVELSTISRSQRGVLRKVLGNINVLYRLAKTCSLPIRKIQQERRRRRLKRQAIKMYPPEI